MKFILFLASLFLAVLFFGWVFLSLIRKKNLRATRFLSAAFSDNNRIGVPIALAFYFWILFFIAASGMLLFIAVMCAFYSFALFHGEFYLLLEQLPLTAGNIAVHIIYPIEIFIFSVLIMVLFVGSFQVFFGPVHPLSRLALQIKGVGDLCRKLIALLAVILTLELTKTAIYSLLVKPEMLDRFFSGKFEPLLHTTPMSAMVGSVLVVSGVVTFVLRVKNKAKKEPSGESD